MRAVSFSTSPALSPRLFLVDNSWHFAVVDFFCGRPLCVRPFSSLIAVILSDEQTATGRERGNIIKAKRASKKSPLTVRLLTWISTFLVALTVVLTLLHLLLCSPPSLPFPSLALPHSMVSLFAAIRPSLRQVNSVKLRIIIFNLSNVRAALATPSAHPHTVQVPYSTVPLTPCCTCSVSSKHFSHTHFT